MRKIFFRQFNILVLMMVAFIIFSNKCHCQNVMYYNHPKDGFYIEESKDRQIVIRHYIKEVRINKKSIDGCDGDVIGINNMTLPSEAGTPNLPASSRYITIPKDCSNFDFEIYYNDSTIFSDIDILPASPLKLDTESDEITVYKDSSIYKNDIFIPTSYWKYQNR